MHRYGGPRLEVQEIVYSCSLRVSVSFWCFFEFYSQVVQPVVVNLEVAALHEYGGLRLPVKEIIEELLARARNDSQLLRVRAPEPASLEH